MQSALSEVELSATTGEHVFGEKHSQALEDLRIKQLKLAQAWARSEADDEVVDGKASDEQNQSAPKTGPQNVGEAVEHGAAENVSFKTLDEETEKDISSPARDERLMTGTLIESTTMFWTWWPNWRKWRKLCVWFSGKVGTYGASLTL